ncbi:MAG: hypothetical protein HY644_10875 [Acidobacteria bacterium]|nr:hypothetical protein [Acidobacteriota bacterium]
MDSIFSINHFLELELWIRSLHVLFRYKRLPFSRQGPQRNFKEELQLALEMLRCIGQLCQQMNSGRSHAGNGALWLEEEAGRFEDGATMLGSMADSVKHFQSILNGMLQQPFVDLRAFDSAGSLLLREFESFRNSAYFKELNRSYFESNVLPVIAAHVLVHIRSVALKVELTEIFLCFVRLIAYLRFVNCRLRNAYKPRHFFLVFTAVYFETQVLARRLKTFADVMSRKELKMGQSFRLVYAALKMESRRVFERELQSIDEAEDGESVRVRLEDSSGLLWNCCQNCFIMLAQCVNPQFNRYEVFENIFERYEQSRRLLNDLKKLTSRLDEATRHGEGYFGLLSDLQTFEQSSMDFLMYKDQLEVHGFVEQLAHSSTVEDRCGKLHRLSVYLDALIAEVRKRSELKTLYEDDRGVVLQ